MDVGRSQDALGEEWISYHRRRKREVAVLRASAPEPGSG